MFVLSNVGTLFDSYPLPMKFGNSHHVVFQSQGNRSQTWRRSPIHDNRHRRIHFRLLRVMESESVDSGDRAIDGWICCLRNGCQYKADGEKE
jgi:hypothetical protein